MQTKRDLAIKEMGKLLLKGWCLTDSSCNECSMPLMRTKEGNHVCTLCSLTFDSLLQKKNSNIIENENTNTNTNTKEEILEPPIKVQKTCSDSDLASKRIGDYLLQGYTLFEECCTLCNVPLVGKKDIDSFCVLCVSKKVQVESVNLNETAELKEIKKQENQQDLKVVLESKISQLSSTLVNTQDISTIKLIADAISSCALAIKSIE